MDWIVKLMALILAVVPHEVAHGYMANRLGDPTARYANRLTLNPLAHVDLFGSIILPLIMLVTGSPVLLGWAKPVPFNPAYFRNPRKGIMWVGLAGPMANFALALVTAILFRALGGVGDLGYPLFYLCMTNIVLGVFNLVPIPPLDGSRVVLGFLPNRLVPAYLGLERYGMILIFVLLWLGVIDLFTRPVMRLLQQLFLGV